MSFDMSRKMADADNSSSDRISINIVKELLKVQESSLKSFVNLLIDNFNSRLDNLNREIQGIKDSLQFSQKDIDVTKSKLDTIDALGLEINSLKASITEFDNKIDYLENQSRRSNVRISGLKEDKNENWATTEQKVKDLLNEKLQIYPEDGFEIERAHRTGKRSVKPRQIVVKFLRYKDREAVLQSSKKLKGTGIYINEDFSSRVVKRRQDQQEKLQQARKEGKIAYFSMDRLVIKPRPMDFNSSQPFGSLGATASFGSYRDALQNGSRMNTGSVSPQSSQDHT